MEGMNESKKKSFIFNDIFHLALGEFIGPLVIIIPAKFQ